VAKFLRDRVRLVVEVAPPVGPAHVVHEGERERAAFARRQLAEELELVIDRVPVVVPVEERRVDSLDAGERVEAPALMEDEAARMCVEQGPDPRLRREGRVDRVDDEAVLGGELHEVCRRVALVDADLDDDARPRGLEYRPYDRFPEEDHG
jgi:hypothetical protein